MRNAASRCLCIISVMLALFVQSAVAIPSRPDPQRLVNDLAGLFSYQQQQELERVLVAFDDSTSNQITVVTVNDLEGYDPAEYATRIGLDWQVGSAEFDNGVVLLVKPKTSDSSGQVFIAVGYGLEGAIPDAYAKRIIENELIPHFRGNDYFGGVEAACGVLMKLASGDISEPREGEDEDEALVALISFIVVILVICLLVAIYNDGNGGGGGSGGRRTIYTGPVITTGRNYGGFSGGFGGGGFGGGFGGFGGGSFGGGGAGGSW